MNVEHLHTEIKKIESVIRMNDLEPDVEGYINYVGDELCIGVGAREAFDANGYWSTRRNFGGPVKDAEKLLNGAMVWAYSLPNAEQRASELMIKKLTEMADKLPNGGSERAHAAWQEIHRMLLRKAETIAQNGLPSPARIQQLGA